MPGRETKLLLVTIAVSVATLLLLARLRFPDRATEVAEPAPAPLERLAAQASYDDLASTMADLDRRVGPSLVIVRVQPDRPTGNYATAVRVTPDRAVLLLQDGESAFTTGSEALTIVARDPASKATVVAVDPAPERVMSPRSGAPRPGPRYVAVADATPAGPALRPLYVGSTRALDDPLLRMPTLSLAVPPNSISAGAALFTLAGTFMGLAAGSGGVLTVVPADVLKSLAEGPARGPQVEPSFDMEVQSLTDALARIAGANRGAIVSYVDPDGPAAGRLQPGDVVQSIDGVAIASAQEFRSVVRGLTPGAAISVALVRRGTFSTVTIAPRALGGAAQGAPDDDGLTLRTVPRVGSEVLTVARRSAAAAAGLQPGDIITGADATAAPSTADIDRAYRALEQNQGLLLAVQRGFERRIVALEKR